MQIRLPHSGVSVAFGAKMQSAILVYQFDTDLLNWVSGRSSSFERNISMKHTVNASWVGGTPLRELSVDHNMPLKQ